MFHRNKLFEAVLAALLVSTPAALAQAQPDPDVEDDADAADADPADTDGAEDDVEDDPDDTTMADQTAKDEDDSGGGWGVGGTEKVGRFAPRGKTGRLKELEEEEQEDEDFTPPVLPPPGFAYLDMAIGFGDMAIAVQDSGATDVTPTASFLIGLGYRIGDLWQVSLRFPISTGKSDGPIDPLTEGGRNPDQYTQIAVGAPEIAVTPHFILSRKVRVPVGLAVTLPTAAGDQFPLVNERAKLGQAIVQQAAAASRGWEDRALFAYNRFSIIPHGGMIFEDEVGPGKLRIIGNMKFEIMADTGGEKPPEGDALGPAELPGALRSVSFNWVTRGEVFYDFFDGLLSPGVKLWFAFATGHESKGSVDPGGAQFVFEPNIMTHLPFSGDKNVGFDGRLGYMIPLGGELGGGGTFPSGIGGLRLTAGLFFGP